jgi:predicted nucleic acid-binding protein
MPFCNRLAQARRFSSATVIYLSPNWFHYLQQPGHRPKNVRLSPKEGCYCRSVNWMKRHSGLSVRKPQSRNRETQRLGEQFRTIERRVTTAFWDASALVPLCIPSSQDASQARKLLSQYRPVVWWGSAVEIWSAVARLNRQGDLTIRERQFAAERFAQLRLSWREVQPTLRVRDLAESHVDRYALRSADALQLAAALDWCNERPKRRSFVSCDRLL